MSMVDGTLQWSRVKATRLGLQRPTKPRKRRLWPWVRRAKLDAMAAQLAALEQRVQSAEAETREVRAVLQQLSQTFSANLSPAASRWPRG